MRSKILILILSLTIVNCFAGTGISSQKAITVAETYYRYTTSYSNAIGKIAFTENDKSGNSLYYIVNMDKTGFVIVSGNAVTHPIIAISTHGNFKTIVNSGVADYLGNLRTHISKLYELNLKPQENITSEWNLLSSGQQIISTRTTSVSPLLTTTWNQNPYYNYYCPGTGSNQAVTGCVATAMAQIVNYWQYPASGTGSYSYSDSPYGTLSSSFDSTINWSLMPGYLSSSSTQKTIDLVASLMYKLGVSVAMQYSPSGSGAYVLQSENPPNGPCAQYSYVNYFGYNSATIQGLVQTNYSTTSWDSIIDVELNNSRPIEYVGYGVDGGHTWVLDGYNSSGLYDMNWGWGGEDNGYFALNDLDPSGIPLGSDNAMLVGIEPGSKASCGVPTSLAANSITTSGATVSWVGSGTPQSYTLNYKLSTASTWTSVAGIKSESYSLTGLTSGSTYDIEVQQVCSSSETSSFTSTVAFATTQPTCSEPTSLAANSITSSGATIVWVGSGTPLSYDLNYKESGADAWTSLTGITSESYSLTGLTAGTTYDIEVQQVCSGSETSGFTSTESFTTNAITYCASAGTSASEYIKTVDFGTIDNTVSNDGGYHNYTNLSTDMTAGTGYKITLAPGFTSSSYTEYWTVFIDYNNTGDFVRVGAKSGTGNISGSISVPRTAINGSTRMRIIMHRGSYIASACSSFTDGDVQDYTVVVSNGVSTDIGLQADDNSNTTSDINGLSVNVYPNPTKGLLNIKYLDNTDIQDIRLVDATGRILLESPAKLDALDLSKYAQGWYLLAITGTDGSVVRKLVMVTH